jgi:hypothetical protein
LKIRCGLRYARSRAKKEGHNLSTQRRRKDKGIANASAKRESATPPISGSGTGSPVYPGTARRSTSGGAGGGYDSSFSAGSGSEVYSHTGHHGLDTLTPSPSPPASSVSFVHYSPHGHAQGQPRSGPAEGRATYGPGGSGSGSGSFYSVPSPLSGPPVMHSQESSAEEMDTYTGRVSPMLSSGSSLTSTVPPASFERERESGERDRVKTKRSRGLLPPTPVSAEPRHHTRRSVITKQEQS